VTEFVGGYLFHHERQDDLFRLTMNRGDFVSLLAASFLRPAEIDPRVWFAIRNQQNEGSCNGHAAAAACEMAAKASGQPQRFSPDAMYYLAQQNDGIRGDAGSTVSGALQVCLEVGPILEANMPYTPRYNPTDLPRNYRELAAPYRLGKGAILKNYREVVEWLGRGFGGVWWGNRWGINPGSSGEVTRWSFGNGGHATALLGYGGSTDGDGLPAYLWLANSWGTTWGLGGWAKVHRAAFEQALTDRWTVVAGVSDMPNLKPRTVDWSKESVFA
jgi:C1A family cysteine protease